MNLKFVCSIILINTLLLFAFIGFSRSTEATAAAGVIVQHYKYLESNDYSRAYALFSEDTRKYLNKDFYKYRENQGIEATSLYRAFEPVFKGDWAVTPYIVFNKMKGIRIPSYNVGILDKRQGSWTLVGDLRAVPGKYGKEVLNLIVQAEGKITKAKEPFEGLSPEEKDLIMIQFETSAKQNKAILEAVNDDK